ncbi:MAG: arylsulfatase [Duncaniella sp.]|nr:arylsulfatase [Muribaculum sp.]MCM1255726.1 arylsulfatase [Duncaniella sp.]
MKGQSLILAAGSLTGLMLAGCAKDKAAESKPASPNVIFILADDLGIGDTSPYGQKLIKTPNLDRMEREGMKFTQSYAGTAVSAPSRASLMTGQHTGHTHIRGNMRHDPEGQVAMPDSTYTMARLFKDAGYATGCFGKWGLGYPGSESDPTKMGFDRFFGYNCQTLAHDYYPDHLWDGLNRVELPENYEQAESKYSADMIHQQALDFIRANADKPFFTFLSYTLPHAELVLPHDSVYDYYCNVIPAADDQAWAEENPNRRGAYGATDRPLASFASMVTRLDSYVGDVMNLLAELGIDDNTIVIFTSDNGPHREGGANPDYFDSYGPYRGIKRDLYEGGIRMPMIIRYPGKIKEGSTNDHILAFWDMMPTFAELTGTELKSNTDGISFLPTLLGKDGQKEHDYLYWEFHEGGGKQALRMGDWKAVRLNVSDSTKRITELYNLATDTHEDNNVADQNTELVARMDFLMDSVRTHSDLFNFNRGER